MTDELKPDVIWLQHNEEYPFCDNTTWCRDQIACDDIKYLRDDGTTLTALRAEIARLREALTGVIESCEWSDYHGKAAYNTAKQAFKETV